MTVSAKQWAWWSEAPDTCLSMLHSTRRGLDNHQVKQRRQSAGSNQILPEQQKHVLHILLEQLSSPLQLILLVACALALITGELLDAGVTLLIVAGSAGMGFFQELSAHRAINSLRKNLSPQSTVLRNGSWRRIASHRIVPGDSVRLKPGNIVPADGVLLQATHCLVNEASLSGESSLVDKNTEPVAPDCPVSRRSNCLFAGTHLHSGMADMLVVKTGHQTLLGKMADQLQQESTPDAFELGVKNLGQVLTKIMLFMVLIVLTVNIVLQKPTAQGLLFALALAVGLTPELLPAIITVTLSKGAMKMAQQGILVRHIRAINNLGSMNILCTDKTGTLTEGNHAVEKAVDTNDLADPAVLRWAALNATFQHGVANPMDAAILSASAQAGMDLGHWTKLAEIPYDYDKRRVCIQLRDEQGQRHWICKGALESVMPLCTQIGSPPRPMLETDQKRLRQQHAQWAEQGLRALAVTHIRSDEAQGMTLLGFVLFSDPPKIDSRATLAQLHALGVEVKMLTGDHPSVAVHIARAVGLQESPVLTGADVDRMSLSQLSRHSAKTAIFAVLTPQQKEKVIHALRSGGHVTAYLGDGMNDALALHSADVGISVSNAVDVARDAADVVLVANSLKLLTQGIVLGRESFANTLKYILSTMSANFGNMLSMAVASLLLPFPPLLASQILLNNLLSDVPGMGIANDSVDEQWIRSPRQWNTHEILENMFVFGCISSLFDALTLVSMLWIFPSSPETLRTVWFVESLLSEIMVALVIRTQHRFYESRPSKALLIPSLLVAVLALVIPFLPGQTMLGFVPLPGSHLLLIVILVLLYVGLVEISKRRIYRLKKNSFKPLAAM